MRPRGADPLDPAAGRSGVEPRGQTHRLLVAALTDGERARGAYQAWRAAVDLDTLDGGSVRLLPLLHDNLKRHLADVAPGDDLVRRIRTVYRLSYFKNELIFRRTAELLARLAMAGIPTMVLKGAALVLGYGEDPSLRPMDDVDVLVPTANAAAAIDVLVAAGLAPVFDTGPSDIKQRFLRLAPGWGFADGSGFEIDLHWHMLHASQHEHSDAEFWAAARPGELHGVATLWPAPADLLLHVCTHGANWNATPPVRWVADATRLIRATGPGLDWERLVRQAHRHRVQVPVAACLEYLRRELEVAVPREVLGRLRDPGAMVRRRGARLAAYVDRREHEARVQDPARRTRVDTALRAYRSFLRGYRDPAAPDGIGDLVAFARHRLGAERAWDLAARSSFVLLGRPWALQFQLRRWLGVSLRDGAGPSLPAIGPGATISFARGGDGENRTGLGWSHPERLGTWTVGRESSIFLRLEPAAVDELALRFRLHPFVVPGHAPLVVDVLVNDLPIACWPLGPQDAVPHERTLQVPGWLARRCVPLELRLCARNPRAPDRVGLSADQRDLGLFLYWLRVGEAPEAPPAISA